MIAKIRKMFTRTAPVSSRSLDALYDDMNDQGLRICFYPKNQVAIISAGRRGRAAAERLLRKEIELRGFPLRVVDFK